MKRYVPPTAEEIQTYLQIVGDIVAAYSNGQEKAMYEGSHAFRSRSTACGAMTTTRWNFHLPGCGATSGFGFERMD